MTERAAGNNLRVVCLVTHTHLGGAQTAMTRLAEELRRRGHRTDVWALYRDPTPGNQMAHCSVVLPQTRPGPIGYVRIAARLIRRLRADRPDAVISFLPLANVVGQASACLAGVPNRIASQRNPCWTYKGPMRIADRIAGARGLYTENVANSEAVRASFARYPRLYRNRLVVVHNGVAHHRSDLSKAAARAKFGLPPAGPVIVNVGRLCEQKNHGFLLSVAARLPHAHVAIAGDGELRAALGERAIDLGIGDRFTLIGHLDRESVADLLAAADLFAQPSLYEGQSNALLEAMSAGLPIVASDIPPQVETLCGRDADAAGLILPLQDEAAWARAIDGMLENSEWKQTLAARARQRAGDFTIASMADGFERAMWRATKAEIRLAARRPIRPTS